MLVFFPVLVMCTDCIGNAEAYNEDIIQFAEDLKHLYYGLISGNADYALNVVWEVVRQLRKRDNSKLARLT